ncbi:MAG: sulfite exporter TauE/SafE family protein [Candidatus Paceibacterota bacterium]|jgi:sulfite exporter TauE/SafE/copper chaperone CopZ
MKTYTFHVHGMHCASCTVLIEGELKKHSSVRDVNASLSGKTVTINGNFDITEPQALVAALGEVIKPFGYTLSLEREEKKKILWKEFYIAVPIALAFITLFIVLQKTGIVDINPSQMGLGAVFAIGLVASVSSCMAVVGGLLLSLSATFAKESSRVSSHVLFHAGRIVGFFALGGVLGALGSVLQISFWVQAIIGIVIGVLMVILGINLMEVFPWMKKLQPTLPKGISKKMLGSANMITGIAPVLVGIATFFLPCGFTQSMQLYALSTGSFWSGAMTMFVFTLGTLPVLALISFGAFALGKKRAYSGVFFKAIGIIVISFALFNIANSFAVLGVIPSLFSF